MTSDMYLRPNTPTARIQHPATAPLETQEDLHYQSQVDKQSAPLDSPANPPSPPKLARVSLELERVEVMKSNHKSAYLVCKRVHVRNVPVPASGGDSRCLRSSIIFICGLRERNAAFHIPLAQTRTGSKYTADKRALVRSRRVASVV